MTLLAVSNGVIQQADDHIRFVYRPRRGRQPGSLEVAGADKADGDPPPFRQTLPLCIRLPRLERTSDRYEPPAHAILRACDQYRIVPKAGQGRVRPVPFPTATAKIYINASHGSRVSKPYPCKK